jgi:hypothetical protein
LIKITQQRYDACSKKEACQKSVVFIDKKLEYEKTYRHQGSKNNTRNLVFKYGSRIGNHKKGKNKERWSINKRVRDTFISRKEIYQRKMSNEKWKNNIQ